MTQAEINQRRGARMRRYADAAGKDYEQVAKEMGRAVSTIHRWWGGERRPSDEDMEQYAKVVGVKKDVFYMPDEQDARNEKQVLEIFKQVVDRLMKDQQIAEALEDSLETDAGTPEEWELPEPASSVLRKSIQEEAGRSWDLLTDRQKLETIHQVIEKAIQKLDE